MAASKKEEKKKMHGIAKVVLWVLVLGAYLYILVGAAKKLERRKVVLVGETGDDGEDRVFPLVVFLAFVGTLMVLGE